MNPREPDHADAFAELLRTTPFNIREAVVKREATIAVIRRDYPAGRKLHSFLAGRCMSEGEARSVIDCERSRMARKFWAKRRAQREDECRN